MGDTYTVPRDIKLYHIVHWDRLASIMRDRHILSSAKMLARQASGTEIGFSRIKRRRLKSVLPGMSGLTVGACVPFYFCPRSIMLSVLHRANDFYLPYHGGQSQIVHLVLDLGPTVRWCYYNEKRWAFTLSNAGAYYFETRTDLADLCEINWPAMTAMRNSDPGVRDGKQAEFLVEDNVSWRLVKAIGVYDQAAFDTVTRILDGRQLRPEVRIERAWYY